MFTMDIDSLSMRKLLPLRVLRLFLFADVGWRMLREGGSVVTVNGLPFAEVHCRDQQ